MKALLMVKLMAHLTDNHPELAMQLQAEMSMTAFLEDRVSLVMPLVAQMQLEDRPAYIVEEAAMKRLIEDIGPSRFNYIQEVLRTEFLVEWERLAGIGVLTFETINLIEKCKDVFVDFGFSADTMESRFLRYAIIAKVHEYFN